MAEKRVLSLNNWQYQTIHYIWSYGNKEKIQRLIDEGETCPHKISMVTGLRYTLYSYYCPCFHLSWISFALLPFVFIFRMAQAILKPVILRLFNSLKEFFDKRSIKGQVEDVKSDYDDARQKYLQAVAKTITYFSEDVKEIPNIYLEDIVYRVQKFLSRSYIRNNDVQAWVEEDFKEIKQAIKNRIEGAQARKKRIDMLVRIASSIFSLVRKLIAILSIIPLIFLIIFVCMAIKRVVPYILSFDYPGFLLLLGKFTITSLIYGVMIVGVIYLVFLSIKKIGASDTAEKFAKNTTSFFGIIKETFFSFILGVDSRLSATIISVYEFVKIFYEENCPPIEIVTKGKDKIK